MSTTPQRRSPQRTVTEDLLLRARELIGGQGITPTPGRQQLLVTYARAVALGSTDPRRAVLRPSNGWLLSPGDAFGAGRAPEEFAISQNQNIIPTRTFSITEEDGLTDSRVPRLAILLHHRNNTWWMETRARTDTQLPVMYPGGAELLSNANRPKPITRRRQTVIVRARSRPDATPGPAAGELVEHRFTILAEWIPDDIPAAGLHSFRSDRTTSVIGDPQWDPQRARVLAAFAYPELIGVPEHGLRTEVSQVILGTAADRDPSERVLARLRRHASLDLGYDIRGKENTPRFLDYIVERRGYLGAAMADLHAEFDRR